MVVGLSLCVSGVSVSEYLVNSIYPIMADFSLTAEDLQLLIAANAHLGSKNTNVCFPLKLREKNERIMKVDELVDTIQKQQARRYQ
ncbi:unnamed protein product [Ambrosiozyma monospora]|uniref:Unnamed protein product n=1 Tax=Ambrosiozyma monospora TaxID=43982 RepID=A0ACB5TN69_AMBMO|nr:unnamed protein product [Ambrosiozyma monospora]